MKHTHRPIDMLIELAAERIGCHIAMVAPADEMEPRTVHVTRSTGEDQTCIVPAKADLSTILSLLLAAYETEDSGS